MANELNGHIMQIVGDPAGGIRRHVHSIIFGLRDIPGLEQSYVCSPAGGDAAYGKDLPRLTEILDGRLLALNIRKKPGFSDIYNLIRIVRYVKARKVSIVHGHGAKGGAYARLLKLFCSVKTVYTPHGGAVHKMFSWPEELIYTVIEKLLFYLTDHFIFESDYTAQAYFSKVGRTPKNWVINYNGVPKPDLPSLAVEAQKLGYSLPDRDGVFNIGVFGILRPQKGQIYALEAIAELKKSGAAVRLHLFGDGPDRPFLKSAASNLGIISHVIFHGEVPDSVPHMYAMDLILIPSMFESFGYVAIEAFSIGKPVVATSVGGLREIIADNVTGLLVKAGDSNAIAFAISALVRDHKKSAKWMRNSSISFRERFTVEVMLGNLLNIYARL